MNGYEKDLKAVSPFVAFVEQSSFLSSSVATDFNRLSDCFLSTVVSDLERGRDIANRLAVLAGYTCFPDAQEVFFRISEACRRESQA